MMDQSQLACATASILYLSFARKGKREEEEKKNAIE